MFYYAYVLHSSKNNSLYIGYTSGLKRRLREHEAGKNKSTRRFRPYKLIFYEAFLNRKDAKLREKYLKSGYRRRTIRKMLSEYFDNKDCQS